jgi:hypothetical protein
VTERIIAGSLFVGFVILFVRWMVSRNAEGTD